jgi:peroxiredoxin
MAPKRLLLSTLLLFSCGGSFNGADTGNTKAGTDDGAADGGATDGGGADGGATDGGGLDGGGTDGGGTDGGGTDGGGTDGGGTDGGGTDGGGTDSGDPGGPYTGGWPQDSCADSIHATGTDVGEVVEDFALLDQYGDTVHLYDFCDHFVLLAFGAAWDGATAARTADLRDWANTYESTGPLLVVQVLGEDAEYQTPTEADLLQWAEDHDLPFPVLADDNFEAFTQYGRTSIPLYVLLNRGMEMQQIAYDLDQWDIMSWLDG